MSRFNLRPQQQRHSRRTNPAARMEMRHVIDMTQVDTDADAEDNDEDEDEDNDNDEASCGSEGDGEEGAGVGLSVGNRKLEKKMQIQMQMDADVVEEETDEPERQVLPGDLLHALATLETFRRMADAGIDDGWGLGAGTVRQMAFFNSFAGSSGGKVPRYYGANGSGDAQQWNWNGNGDSAGGGGGNNNNNKETGVAADIGVNLDGRVPARAKFKRGEAMYDIPIKPLAEWLSLLTDPDHLEKVRFTLENAATPYDYFRIDERINEAYRPPICANHTTAHDGMLNNNVYAPWISARRSGGGETDVPNVPIVRELRIDITTLHPSAIYRLEQLRRRQLRQRVLPMRMDVWVEEKESEWTKQRTREKRAAQRAEREKERQRLQVEQEKERQRLLEEKRKQQEETVRRHLGLSTNNTPRRTRRNTEQDDHSDRSSEMSPVPSNISSPSPPPPQIFHEVQESVPFPFAPSSPLAASSQPVIATSYSRPAPISSTTQPRLAEPVGQTSDMDGVIDLTAPEGPIAAAPRRIKFKFKGASLSLATNSNHQEPANNAVKPPCGPGSLQRTPRARSSSVTPTAAEPRASAAAPLSNGDARQRRPPPILSHASLAEMGIVSAPGARDDNASKRTERHKGALPAVAVSELNDSSIRSPPAEVDDAHQTSPHDLPTTMTSTSEIRDSPRSTSTSNVAEKLGIMLTDQQVAETSAGKHSDSANKVVIDLTLALDGDEIDAVVPAFPSRPSRRARRRITTPEGTGEPSHVRSSHSQQQDEEDEARVEELDILGEVNPDDSPDCMMQEDGYMPVGFMEDSRSSRGKTTSSLAARSREVIIVIDDDTDEDDVGDMSKTIPLPLTSSTSKRGTAEQLLNHPSVIAEQVSSVDHTPIVSVQRDTSDEASGSDLSKRQDTDTDMMIDNELEPVSLEDTRSWELQCDSPPPELGLNSPDDDDDDDDGNNNKGPQRTSGHKGKARADQLNLTINTLSDDGALQVEKCSENRATSSRVIQVRGITGPTATDTEDSSANTTSANTPLRSPVLHEGSAAISAQPRPISVSLTPSSSYAHPPSSASELAAPAETPALSLPSRPIVPFASQAAATPLASEVMTDIMPPVLQPSVTVQTVQMPIESQSQSVPNSVRSALARQRQSEAFYAALASSFLNRCGAAPSLPNMYDAGSSSQMRHHPPGLWFNSSEGTSQSSSTPPDQYMLQQRASITTTCDPRDVFGRIKAEEPDIAPNHESKRSDVNTSSDNERQEAEEDGMLERDTYKAHRRYSKESSPLEHTIIEATVRETPAASRSRPAEVSDDEYEPQETTWHRQGRASRGKRKNYAEVPVEDIRPPKRQRTSASSRNSRAPVYEVQDESDEEELAWITGDTHRYRHKVLEVCIPLPRRRVSPLPPPVPRMPRPNLKIILKV